MSAPAAKPVRVHIAALDGLRGFACLLVVLCHCWAFAGSYEWPRFAVAGLDIRPYMLLRNSWNGVDLFFVLSGFCLAYPFLVKPASTWDWRRYFVNRLRRIAPPYWVATVVFSAVGWAIARYQIEPLASGKYLFFDASLRNIALSLSLVGSTTMWAYWTLPVEWRWYFAFPLLLLLAVRTRPHWSLLVGSIVSLAGVLLWEGGQGGPRLRYFMTEMPLYLSTFALGLYAAQIFVAAPEKRSPVEATLLRTAPYLAPLLIAVSYTLFAIPGPMQYFNDHWAWGRLLTFGPAYFFLVLAAVTHAPTMRVFSWRPLTNLGLISYSLYLTHEIPIRAAYIFTKPLGWSLPAQFAFYELLVAPVCIAFAALFFVCAERPFLRRGAGTTTVPVARAASVRDPQPVGAEATR